MAVTAFMFAKSQDEAIIIKASNKVSKKMTPQQIIDSLNARFPDAQSVQAFKATPDIVSRGWTVSKEDNLGHDMEIEYYTISFKSHGLDYYGLFAADGRLIRSKQQSTVEELPEPVKTSLKSLSAQHPGYTVTSKKYFKNLDSKSMKEYYEVIAQNGDQKRSLYYSADGTLQEIKKD
jgi:hypothetical protein